MKAQCFYDRLKDMKVLYIASGDSKYGAPKALMNMLLHMKEYCDVEPVLLTKKRNRLNEMCDEHQIENYSCWYCDFMCGSPYTFWPMKAAKHMVKYLLYLYGSVCRRSVLKTGIDFEQIDIIHTNHNRIAIGAYISRKYKKPHVWHIREFGIEDYHVSFYRPGTISYMNKSADAFITISDAVKTCWVKKGLNAQKTLTVYDGLEVETIHTPSASGSLGPGLRLVIVGHIQESKGQLQLVNAVAFLPEEIRKNIYVDIIGEGYQEYISKIKKVVQKNKYMNIHFLGYCDHVSQILPKYDVGVMCSQSEGYGLVTVEYMLAGLIVIASDTGANPELLRKAGCGMLYKYGDTRSLADCIRSIYENKEQYRKRSVPTQEFSIKESVERIFQIYQKILKNKELGLP